MSEPSPLGAASRRFSPSLALHDRAYACQGGKCKNPWVRGWIRKQGLVKGSCRSRLDCRLGTRYCKSRSGKLMLRCFCECLFSLQPRSTNPRFTTPSKTLPFCFLHPRVRPCHKLGAVMMASVSDVILTLGPVHYAPPPSAGSRPRGAAIHTSISFSMYTSIVPIHITPRTYNYRGLPLTTSYPSRDQSPTPRAQRFNFLKRNTVNHYH